jgi:hypothetical protein
MGWEWRTFYNGDLTGKFLTHANILLPLVMVCPLESRFDVYVSCCDEMGVKARGDYSTPEIEIKSRTKRTEQGVERWKKVFE